MKTKTEENSDVTHNGSFGVLDCRKRQWHHRRNYWTLMCLIMAN